MEEKEIRDPREDQDPVPLTDEELAEYQKRERRKVGIIGTIIEFIVGFFH